MKRLIILILATILTFNCFAQKHTDHYENGNKKYQETKKDGHFVGKRTWWYENGQKKSEAYYDEAGVLTGNKQWDENGNVIADDDFKKQQKKAGKTDLSKIQWTFTDKIGISFENNGTGELPSEGETVVLQYIGYFENGEQFDNSYEREQPLEFRVGNNYLLESFAKSIAKFKQGQKGYIKIPPELAYGNKPAGNIPPNSTLIYFVEIIQIK